MTAEEKADAMLVVRIMMSEVEEHATDTDSKNATSEPPAKKMKVEQSSSENDFMADLFCVSTAAPVKDELDSYLPLLTVDLTCSTTGVERRTSGQS